MDLTQSTGPSLPDETPRGAPESAPLDFSELYANEYSALVFSARRITRDALEAEDVAQEAFLYLMTSGATLRTSDDAVRFLRWKVRNLAIDRLRKVTPISVDPADESGLFQPPIQLNGVDEFETAEEAAIVSLALSKLPARQKESLIRQHVLGQPIELAAKEMDLSANALRQLSSRGRRSFVRTLQDELDKRGLSPSEFLRGRYAKVLGVASVLVVFLAVGTSLQNAVPQPSLVVSAELPASIADTNQFTPPLQSPAIEEGITSTGSSSEITGSTNPEAIQDDSFGSIDTGSGQVQLASATTETLELTTTASDRETTSTEPIPELQVSSLEATYLENRLITQLTNAEASLKSVSEDEGLIRTLAFDGEGIEAAIRFVDDGRSQSGVAWVYFRIDDVVAGNYWVAPAVHHLTLQRNVDGSLTGISLVATDFIVGDASGKHQFKTSSNTDLAPTYFFLDAEVKNSGVKKIALRTTNFTVGA